LIVLSVCSIFLAAALLVPVMLAGRARAGRARRHATVTGPVQGGIHQGDGRSVAPHRDAPPKFTTRKGGAGHPEPGTGADEG